MLLLGQESSQLSFRRPPGALDRDVPVAHTPGRVPAEIDPELPDSSSALPDASRRRSSPTCWVVSWVEAYSETVRDGSITYLPANLSEPVGGLEPPT